MSMTEITVPTSCFIKVFSDDLGSDDKVNFLPCLKVESFPEAYCCFLVFWGFFCFFFIDPAMRPKVVILTQSRNVLRRSSVSNGMNAERSIGITAEQLEAYLLAYMEVTFCEVIFQGLIGFMCCFERPKGRICVSLVNILWPFKRAYLSISWKTHAKILR